MMPSPKIVVTSKSIDVFKEQRQELVSRFETMPALEFLNAHALQVDEYFLSSFAQSAIGPQMGIMRNPYVLIALGGCSPEGSGKSEKTSSNA